MARPSRIMPKLSGCSAATKPPPRLTTMSPTQNTRSAR
jgi:hypothetical protein